MSRIVKIINLCLILMVLPCVAGASPDPHKTLLDTVSRGSDLRMPFFCSSSGERFAIIEVASLAPARRRVGPFSVPVPGHERGSMALRLYSYSCTQTDWLRLQETLSKFISKNRAATLMVFLPETSEPVRGYLRSCSTDGIQISAYLSPQSDALSSLSYATSSQRLAFEEP